jgi:hypothetical protein
MTGAAPITDARSRSKDCSVLWDKAQATALGTAPPAVFWVALEQNGPWGARVATQSRLEPKLGARLDRACQDMGGRLILIRRPGSHSDLRQGPGQKGPNRRIYLAGALRERPWLLQADLDDPARLAQLPMEYLARGDIDTVRDALPELEASPGPVLMICANSRRDLCCSLRGRPVATASAAQRPGQVWECSHIGGHRFAPTGVVLPYGQTYGHLSSQAAVAVVDAAARGEVPDELLGGMYDRGRSHLSAPGQAAESIVRAKIGERALLALTTNAAAHQSREDTWQCRVSHADGRHWDVMVVRSATGDDLPTSCGKQAVPRWQWSLVSGSCR